MVFTSDGDGDLKDGVDTFEWVLEQEWSDGHIGTFGGSARGIVQYMQNSADPPGLEVFDASGIPGVVDTIENGPEAGAAARAEAAGELVQVGGCVAGGAACQFFGDAVENPVAPECHPGLFDGSEVGRGIQRVDLVVARRTEDCCQPRAIRRIVGRRRP